MKLLLGSRSLFSLALCGSLLLSACSPDRDPENQSGAEEEAIDDDSGLFAVDIPHTSIKWQSIGNCWIYAFFGWAESLIIQYSGEQRNFSESYISYRHFEQQILAGATELRTGGSFMYARRLAQQYGLMYEGDFIPQEADRARSNVQAKALAYLNESLSRGPLSNTSTRSMALVRSELDKAFGVQLANLRPLIFYPSDLAVSDSTSLEDALAVTREVGASPNASSNKPESALPEAPSGYSEAEVQLMRRVMRALNDNYPVVINWFVDFNGLTPEGRFDINAVKRAGSGNQGYHSTVIEDYTAKGVAPDGSAFEVGEGLADEESQNLAASSGRLTSIIIKNSWGGADRPDRFSYPIEGEYGYHRLEDNYLYGYMKEFDQDDKTRFIRAKRGITSFILPLGY